MAKIKSLPHLELFFLQVVLSCALVILTPVILFAQHFDRDLNDVSVSDGEFLANIENYYSNVLNGQIRVDWFVNRVINLSHSRNSFVNELGKLGKLDKSVKTGLADNLYPVVLEALLVSSVSKANGLESLLSLLDDRVEGNVQDTSNAALDVKTKISELFDTARKAEKLSVSKDYKEFIVFMDSLSSDADKLQIAQARFIPVAILQAIKLAEDDSLGAFIILADIPKTWRGEEVFSAAKKALIHISKDLKKYNRSTNEIISSSAFELADELEDYDVTVGELVARLRSHWVLALIRLDKVQEADFQYSCVVESRRDPNEENNELRFQMILQAKSAQAKDLVAGRMLELMQAGALTRSRKVKLLLSGYYGYDFLYMGGVAVAIVLSIVALFKFYLFFLIQLKKVKTRVSANKRKNLPGYMKPTTDLDEYSGLLAVLELEDDASESDIKKAYRERMKELHPDKATEDQNKEERAAQFMKLKRAYERIMEIHDKRFHS